MNKKYQIFISSTYIDLKNEREAVRDAILRMQHFPVGMEQFGAADEKQWDIITSLIDTSDYYVLIIGNRYGSIINEGNLDSAGMSYTEKEMRYADEKKVPILAFIVDESVGIKQDQRESDEQYEKLNHFKSYVRSRATVATWNSPDNLAALVTSSLHNQFLRIDRPGWVRGMDKSSAYRSLQVFNDLSQRMKELEKENIELKGRLSTYRAPALNVSISASETLKKAIDDFKHWNNSEGDNIKFENTEEGLIIHMRRIPCEGYIGNIDKLFMNEVPDEYKAFITQKQLDEYNEELPSHDEVDEYNRKMHEYKSIKENGVIVDVSIFNDGNVKANDINIDFEFPESFIVMKRANAVDFPMPLCPKMPSNPIDEAEIKCNKRGIMSQDSLGDYFSTLGFSKRGIADVVTPMFSSSAFLSESIIEKPGYWISAEGHTAHVQRNSLMHKHMWNQGRFCIAPTEAGEFIVKISMICEELTDIVESEVKIIVIDEGYVY